jgi:cytochrome c oxidase subunit II
MAEPQAPAAQPPAAESGHGGEPNHWLWIFSIWFVVSLAADLVIWFVWYPHMPPGRMTDQARGQQFDIAVMAVICAPVLVGVWTYFGYCLVRWRRRPGDDTDGPAIHGHTGIQAAWITVTSAIVLGLFVFGTYELIAPNGAGAGQGPSPIWKPAGNITTTVWEPGSNHTLQVQVIGQEWWFTYRYPQFGGMQSTQLVLPVNTPIEFHVTSLDVIHSFWAYLLGVKVDANPGVDNVAYVTPQHTGGFIVRCNELCGLWHGAMFSHNRVVSAAAFQAWATLVQGKEQRDNVLTALPPYALTYDPTVVPQLGRDIVKVAGITGANGYYYPGPQAGVPGNPVSP